LIPLLLSVGCAKHTSSTRYPSFPTWTTANVPEPAPVPWDGVKAYSERTYEIEVSVGDEFAIGIFETGSYANLITKSYNYELISLVDTEEVLYQPTAVNHYGTVWFLFKATSAGKASIIFTAPLEYIKLFVVSIQ